MDASRDIIESAKPPKPPKPGARPRPEPTDGERSTSPFTWVVAVSAAAAAVFTGVTAWETHQDRVNTETVYCSFMSDAGPDELSDGQQRIADQLGCQ